MGVSTERPNALLDAEQSRPTGWFARRRLGAAAGLCSNAWAPRTDACAPSTAGPATRPPASSRTGLLGMQSRHKSRCQGRGSGGRRGAGAQSRHKQELLRHPVTRSSPASASAALAGCTSAIGGLSCGKPAPAKTGGRPERQAARLSAPPARRARPPPAPAPPRAWRAGSPARAWPLQSFLRCAPQDTTSWAADREASKGACAQLCDLRFCLSRHMV